VRKKTVGKVAGMAGISANHGKLWHLGHWLCGAWRR